MTIRQSLLSLLILFSLIAHSADVSPLTRLLIRNHTEQRRAKGVHEPQRLPYQPLILQIANQDVRGKLSDYGVIEYGSRADMLLVSVPVDSLNEVLRLDGVVNASASGDMSSCLDRSRTMGRVDAVHAGIDGLPQGYDGSGIVVGFCDIGFDPNHIAFRCRVRELYDTDAYMGIRRCALTPDSISRWTTDCYDEYHATHVAGILSGAHVNEYGGVAPGARIVATTSRLSDVGILSGAQAVIDYARREGLPAVINISMSNHLGPHDGTDLLCRYLAELAKEATICISAGNSGTERVSACHTFTASDSVAKVMLNTLRTYDGVAVAGYVDIWSASAAKLSAYIEVYDMQEDATVWRSPSTNGSTPLSLGPDTPGWNRYLDGVMIIEGALSPLNNRYNLTAVCDYECPARYQGHDWGRYYAVICVEGPHGEHVDIYSDAVGVYLGPTPGANTKIGAHISINDMCTADGIISVGAITSRDSAPSAYSSEPFRWDITTDHIAPFSSYSDCPRVAPLPLIAAPGHFVVSAANSYFIESAEYTDVSKVANIDGRDYHWVPTCGTSMSSPYVAGVMALWLQACPTLTTPELIKIAQATARTDFVDITDPRWGAGCIDALAGLKKILSSGAGDVNVAHPIIEVTPDHHIIVTGANNYTIHDLSGRTITTDTPLPPGIYIVTVPPGRTYKIAVK